MIRVVALSALAYGAAAALGLWTALPGSAACPVWPAAGVAYAAVVWGGRWAALGVFAAAWAANSALLLHMRAPGAVGIGAVGALGNAAEPLLLAWALTRSHRPALPTDIDGVAPFFGASALACLASGLWGPCVHAALGAIPWALVSDSVPTWALGDWAGLLLVAPAILWWRSLRIDGTRTERAAIGAFLASFALLAFVYGGVPTVALPPLATLWVALRYGGASAAWTACALSAIAILGEVCSPHPGAPWAMLSLQATALGRAVVAIAVGVAVDAGRRRESGLVDALATARESLARAVALGRALDRMVPT